MKEKKIVLDPLWNLENASANLNEDIQFLKCIDSEYFQKGKNECSVYLYCQFEAIIKTLKRSLECTQMNMKQCIEAIYKENNKVNKGELKNGYKGDYKK